MAQLAVGVAGAAIGAYFGAPGVGLALGMAVGGVLFPQDGPPDQVAEGPRIHDLKVQTSAWGQMIPIVYGQARLAGNLIWAGTLGHRTEQDNVGGKGGMGGGGETKTRVYYRSFAVAICAGPITRVHRIWANNALIYDATVSPISNPRGAVIYPGSDSQDPDPVIEAAEGLGKAPAYRGTAYVVFERMTLTDFGGMLPSLAFEVEA